MAHPSDTPAAAGQERLTVTMRRLAATVAAILGAVAFAGMLPGDTVVLGLFSSAPLLDAARAVGAIALGVVLVRRGIDDAAPVLRAWAVGATALGLILLVDPSVSGLVRPDARLGDPVLLLCTAAVTATIVRMLARRG